MNHFNFANLTIYGIVFAVFLIRVEADCNSFPGLPGRDGIPGQQGRDGRDGTLDQWVLQEVSWVLPLCIYSHLTKTLHVD